MALFPRRIGGRYAMLGRQGGENITLMFSDEIHRWDDCEVLLRPEAPWEYVQIGNCGSPLETHAGWLVLTHGVGAMRNYCIGAALLDRRRPATGDRAVESAAAGAARPRTRRLRSERGL